MIPLRTNAIILGLLLAMLLVAPMTAIADEGDGKPVASPQTITVNAGDAFDLEVPIQAWAHSNYTVSFLERTRFSFPGSLSVAHEMFSSDAILFKVPCQVEDDAPDGVYRMAYEVTWNVDDVEQKVFGEVEIQVGEGTGDGLACNSMVMVAGPAVLAFSLLIVQRRRYP